MREGLATGSSRYMCCFGFGFAVVCACFGLRVISFSFCHRLGHYNFSSSSSFSSSIE